MYSFLLAVAAILVATKLLSELARRFGQSSVIGALFAGALLGGSALGLVDPHDPALHALSQLGLLVLVFQMGLRSDVRALRRARSATGAVAAVAILLPFAGGFAVAHALGARVLSSLVAGAVLSATSFGIAGRVLGDAGVLRTREGEVALAAGLGADVFGVLVLSVLLALDNATKITVAAVGRTAVIAVAFVAITFVIGNYAVPPLFRVLDRIRGRDSLGLFGVSLAIILAAIATASGLAMIIGAFLAGVILQPTPQRHEIDRTSTSLGHFLVPIFFAVVGASIQLSVLPASAVLALTVLFVAVGIGGKIVAGFAPISFRGNKLLIGSAMVPNGEIGLIFVQMALAAAALTPELFAALVMAVLVTTLITPPLVRMVVARDEELDREETTPAEAFKTPDGRRLTTAGRKQTPTGR